MIIIKVQKINHTYIFLYGNTREMKQEKISNIVYFSSMARKITMHTIDRNIEFYARMKELYEVLGSYGFEYVNQSMIVNLMHVRGIHGKTVCIEKGNMTEEIELSRSRKRLFKQRMVNISDSR